MVRLRPKPNFFFRIDKQNVSWKTKTTTNHNHLFSFWIIVVFFFAWLSVSHLMSLSLHFIISLRSFFLIPPVFVSIYWKIRIDIINGCMCLPVQTKLNDKHCIELWFVLLLLLHAWYAWWRSIVILEDSVAYLLSIEVYSTYGNFTLIIMHCSFQSHRVLEQSTTVKALQFAHRMYTRKKISTCASSRKFIALYTHLCDWLEQMQRCTFIYSYSHW